MSDKAAINIADIRSGFEVVIYLHMQGRRAEEMVARALKRSLNYKPHDPQSVTMFIIGEIARSLGDESVFVGPGMVESGVYRTITVDTAQQKVWYTSIYDGDPDRELDYELFYAEMEGRLAAGVIEHV